MSKYKHFDEWWNINGYEPACGSGKYLAEKAYESAIRKVLEEVFDEVQYQYSVNVAHEIILNIKKSMENKDD